jgi:RNA recognition motif-containing protein
MAEVTKENKEENRKEVKATTSKDMKENPTPAEAAAAGSDAAQQAKAEEAPVVGKEEKVKDEDASGDVDAGADVENTDSDADPDAPTSSTGKEKKSFQKRAGGKRYNHRGNKAFYHQPDNSDPSCRVYVGNLSWNVTWKELKEHMKTSGSEVIRSDILAFPDGRSKGCGIVEFADAEAAQKALLLNDTELMGRQIFVREDRENESGGGYYTQQPGPSGGASGRVSGKEKQSCRVYVGNLSWNVAWQDLKDHMRQVGEVVFAEVMTEADGRSKGCGICEYSTPEEAQKACAELTNTELKDRTIFVREDRESTSGGHQRSGMHGGTSVYVGNLSYETSWQDLKDHMRQAGNVDQANILKTEDGRSKGCGLVVYQQSRDAARAIHELQNTVLNGRPIFVREDREQGGRGSRGNQRNGNRGGNRGGYANKKDRP